MHDIDLFYVNQVVNMEDIYLSRLQKLIQALRSNDYVKIKTNLRETGPDQNKKYCCVFGVVCDIYDPSGWIEPLAPANYFQYRYKHNMHKSFIPTDIENWYGNLLYVDADKVKGPAGMEIQNIVQQDYFQDLIQQQKFDHHKVSLMLLNDCTVISFPELADVLYETYIVSATGREILHE